MAEAVASRHSDCIAEAAEPGMIVLVFVEVMKWEALSQRVVRQGRSLPESSSWIGEKRCADRLELKQQMDPGGLEHSSKWLSGDQEVEYIHETCEQ